MFQNGPKMGAQINEQKHKKSTKKRHAENDAKNWCEKSSAEIKKKPGWIDQNAPWGAFLADLGEGGWLETSKYQADLT